MDLLGPDGLKSPPITLGNRETVEIPGGTQALKRTEIVTISIPDTVPTPIRRPSLLGAILLKARALTVHERPRDQEQDLILLLGFVEDPRAMRRELTGSEKSWLRKAYENLDLRSPHLLDHFPEAGLRKARTTLDLLIT